MRRSVQSSGTSVGGMGGVGTGGAGGGVIGLHVLPFNTQMSSVAHCWGVRYRQFCVQFCELLYTQVGWALHWDGSL
jgi:hypothetical protein